VRFSLDGKVIGEARTDAEGLASVPWTVPARGDHLIALTLVPPAGEAEAKGEEKAEAKPEEKDAEPVTLLVACRAPDVPVAVIDMDKTLVASGFWEVIAGSARLPKPMAGSQKAVRRIAQDHFVIYLTHRPDYFTPKSKGWLKAHDYPQGPVLMSSVISLVRGSETYKRSVLRELGRSFKNLKVGIGDKAGDMKAYHANGMKAVLIMPEPSDKDDADDYEDLIEKLEDVPAGVQVVESWSGVEDVLYGGADQPAATRLRELRLRVRQLKARD
jgi:hypothetical protein